MHIPIFAFDFSMAKPAMSALINNKLELYIWPSEIDSKSHQILEDCGINVIDRNLEKITEFKKSLENTGAGSISIESALIKEHVERASCLASMICDKMIELLKSHDIDAGEAIIANEGFSFSAKGDAVLDLAGYKYILMDRMMEAGFKNFVTYSPMTLKCTAGCSKKKKASLGKTPIIDALSSQKKGVHAFIDVMIESPNLLKKSTAYCKCVDDIADSYWCLKTVIEKEDIDCTLR